MRSGQPRIYTMYNDNLHILLSYPNAKQKDQATANSHAPLSLSIATRLAGSSGSGYKLRSHSFIKSDVARLMLLGRRFSTGGRISSSLELGDVVGPERREDLFLLTSVSEGF